MRYLIIALLLTASCASKKPEAAPAAEKKEGAAAFFHPDPAASGKVEIVATFRGNKPPSKRLSMDADPDCQKLNPKGIAENVIIKDSQGYLANVMVYIKSGLEDKKFEPSTEAVVLEQQGCMYVPRVMGIQAGQPLLVKNTDPVSHNIHAIPKENAEWNQQQPPESPELKRRFLKPEIMVPIKCNIHAWMKSYVAVLDHPYFGVTDIEGRVKWANVPPGKYTVTAWHEVLGEAIEEVSVTVGGTATMKFVFNANGPDMPEKEAAPKKSAH